METANNSPRVVGKGEFNLTNRGRILTFSYFLNILKFGIRLYTDQNKGIPFGDHIQIFFITIEQ